MYNLFIMKTKAINNKKLVSSVLFILCLAFVSCGTRSVKQTLRFTDFPDLQIGFSTQNFQKAMPNNIENLTEIIEYAATEGYQFIELRDDLAKLSTEECKVLAEVAKRNKVDVIYEIHKNLLDSGFFDVFEKGLDNALIFPGPGIIRTVISRSEFEDDASKKGWNKDELLLLIKIADSCASVAKTKNVQFIVENFNEAFFGDGINYYGLDNFFTNTAFTGLQFDTGNPFSKTVREKADPEEVLIFLSTFGNRWVTTHLKTINVVGGVMQPMLTDNPLPVEKVVTLMGQQNVLYAALELASVDDKEQCYANHTKSIQFLKDKGILQK